MTVAHDTWTSKALSNLIGLSPEHHHYLTERAVEPHVALYGAGVHTVSAADGARLLGFTCALSSSGLAVPYPNSADYVRVRLDEGGGYLAPADREVPIYIPPGCQREGDEPLYIVEGPIKALAMEDNGFNTIGLGGVATTLTKDYKLNASWQNLALVRRTVFIVFDANRQNNIEVARAEARLVAALEAAGARVRVVALPLREDGTDQGPDDFLAGCDRDEKALRALIVEAVSGNPVERAKLLTSKAEALLLLEDLPFLLAVHERGPVVQETVADALAAQKVTRTLLRQALKRAAEDGKRGKASVPAVVGYDVREGCLCQITSDGSTEQVAPLANFSARVVEDRTLDDGSGESAHVFVLEGALADGTALPRISLTPEEFNGDLWPTAKWGSPVVVSAIPRSAHHAMNAIKICSQSACTTAFTHTGWRQENGNWFFLHGGGAVGAAQVLVDLSGGAAKFTLPETVDDVRTAVNASVESLGVADERITRPLHSGAFRAPLNEAQRCDTAVALYGKSGSLKSAIAAVSQCHFGDFDYNSLPLSWESTANSLEGDLFHAKDVLAVIDDFVPKAELYDDMHKKAERIFRSIGNGSSRGRLRQDLTARPDRPCRALVVTTGEDLPRGESVQARLVAIHVERKDVNIGQLTKMQAQQHLLSQSMRAYVEWVRPRMTQFKTEVKKKYQEFRQSFNVVGHLRAPSAMAHLLVGAYYFAEFAKDVGVMTDAEAKAHVETTRAALLANALEQVRATELSDPAKRFMDVLRAMYARRAIALKPVGQTLTPFTDGGTPVVGWKDDHFAYIEPGKIREIVNTHLTATNERLAIQPHGLWQRMAAEGFIVPGSDEDMTPKFTGAKGTRLRVMQVPLSQLISPEPDPEGGPGQGPGPEADSEPDGDHEWPQPDDDGSEPPVGFAPGPSWLPPANTQAAQEPKTCPEVFGLLGGEMDPGIPSSTPQVAFPRSNLKEGSAQEPKSLGERLPQDCAFTTPRDGQRAHEPNTGASLPPGNTWALGRTAGDPLAAAILHAGEVGLAVGDEGARTVVVLAVPSGATHIIDLPVSPHVGEALGKVRLVGHGLKPVVALLHQHGICRVQVFDTEIAWRLYDGHRHEASSPFFTLDSARTAMGIAAIAAGASSHDRLRADAEHALLLEPILVTLLEEDGLEEVAELEMSLLPIVAEMEATGVAIDAAAWKKVTSAWSAEAATLREKLTKALGVKNVDNGEHVLAALQRLGLPLKKTSGEALAPYSDRPVVAQLMRYRTLDGFVRSSGKAVLEALERSPDGRVRTHIHQLGARTGRMSCSEPNLMGLPKAKEIRACIVAPPGMKLIVPDYNNIEMRVLADRAGDAKLRAVFDDPKGDAHRHTAAVLRKKPSEKDVSDDERKNAKPLNFGLSFGMGDDTLIAHALKGYGVSLSREDASRFRADFFDHYKGIKTWQEQIAREMPTEQRTASGRVGYQRSSDEGYNARLSYPIQGTAADGMKAAMVLLHPQLARLGARIVLVVHDELVVEAPEDHAEEVRVLVRDAMIEGMKRFVTSVPIVVEPEVRSSWAK